MVDAPPPDNVFLYIVSLLKHMILPSSSLYVKSNMSWHFLMAYFLSKFIQAKIICRDGKKPRVWTAVTFKINTSCGQHCNDYYKFCIIGDQFVDGAPFLRLFLAGLDWYRAFIRPSNCFDTPVIIGETVIFSFLLATTFLNWTLCMLGWSQSKDRRKLGMQKKLRDIFNTQCGICVCIHLLIVRGCSF